MPQSNKMVGREPSWDGSWADAVAPTTSDTADDPAGEAQGIMCTGNGNVRVTLASGRDFTFALTAGYANLQRWRIRRVWTTNTTATGILLLYV